MGKSAGIPRTSLPAGFPDARSRWRTRVSVLVSILAVFLVVIFVFPVAFPLRIDVPAQVQFGNPSSLMFQISNQNLTPLTNIEYRCAVAQLTLANGSPVKDVNTLSQGYIPRIGGRHGVTGRCQTAYFVPGPLKTAAYELTVTYRPYPWPKRRTQVVRISALLDGKGELAGWKVD
jgi:hypothetical protein